MKSFYEPTSTGPGVPLPALPDPLLIRKATGLMPNLKLNGRLVKCLQCVIDIFECHRDKLISD